jgi:hypothetical protein
MSTQSQVELWLRQPPRRAIARRPAKLTQGIYARTVGGSPRFCQAPPFRWFFSPDIVLRFTPNTRATSAADLPPFNRARASCFCVAALGIRQGNLEINNSPESCSAPHRPISGQNRVAVGHLLQEFFHCGLGFARRPTRLSNFCRTAAAQAHQAALRFDTISSTPERIRFALRPPC